MIIDTEQCVRCEKFIEVSELRHVVDLLDGHSRSLSGLQRVCKDCYTERDRRNADSLPGHRHAGGRCECHLIAMRQKPTGL